MTTPAAILGAAMAFLLGLLMAANRPCDCGELEAEPEEEPPFSFVPYDGEAVGV